MLSWQTELWREEVAWMKGPHQVNNVNGRLRIMYFLKTDTPVKVSICLCYGKLHSFQNTSAFSILKRAFVESCGQLYNHWWQTRSHGHHTCYFFCWDILSTLTPPPHSWPLLASLPYMGPASSAQGAAPPTCCHHSATREGLGENDLTETKREGWN